MSSEPSKAARELVVVRVSPNEPRSFGDCGDNWEVILIHGDRDFILHHGWESDCRAVQATAQQIIDAALADERDAAEKLRDAATLLVQDMRDLRFRLQPYGDIRPAENATWDALTTYRKATGATP